MKIFDSIYKSFLFRYIPFIRKISDKLLVTLLSVLLFGCVQPPLKMDSKHKLNSILSQAILSNKMISGKKANRNSEIPDFVLKSINPQKVFAGNSNSLNYRTYNVNVNKMPLNQFMGFLSKMTGLNFNYGILPRFIITMHMNKSTLPEIINLIRNKYSLEFKRTGSDFFVDLDHLEVKYFYLPQLNMVRKAKGNSFSPLKDVESNISSTSSGKEIWQAIKEGLTKIVNADGSRIKAKIIANLALTSNREIKPGSKSKGITVRYEDIYKSNEIGSVTINKESGLITVIAFHGALKDITSYISKLSKIQSSQVMVEAKILDVTLNKTHQAGIDWNSIYSQFSGASTLQEKYPNGSLLNGSSFKIAVPEISGTFSAIIRAINEQGTVSVISSPMVVTTDSQPANLVVGKLEKFLSGIQNTTTTNSTTSNDTSNTETEDAFSGISLTVIPRILNRNTVMMSVLPEISRVTPKSISIEGSPENPNVVKFDVPQTEIRRTDDVVISKSGQTIIIGGLNENRTQNLESGLPGHGILSRLTRSGGQGLSKHQLIILLRTVVLTDNGVNNEIKNSFLTNNS